MRKMSAVNYTKSLIKEKENNYVRKEYYHSSGNKRRLQSRRKPDPRVILECLSAWLYGALCAMEKAKEMGAGALAITGNIDFYGKSGFVPAKTKGVCYADDPDADYFLIRELTPGFLDGVSGTYKDPEGYFVCEKDPDGFERFEATFPVKEKQKLPGQLF